MTNSETLADAVEAEIEKRKFANLVARQEIARASIGNNGRIIIAENVDGMFDLMNQVAQSIWKWLWKMLMII